MAKNNNLTDFLTDVADAIREKKGTTGKINPQDFSSEIKSIESGEGEAVESKEYKDVNFFDYDGTVLYSYTWAEAEALTELPPLPNRKSEGLICEGWNYTLEELKEQEGRANIGALYKTDDDSVRLEIVIPSMDRTEVPLYYYHQNSGETSEIDWGDGTEKEQHSTTPINTTHKYTTIGKFTIKIKNLTNRSKIELGGTSTGQSVIGNSTDSNVVYRNMLKRAILGSNVYLASNAFKSSYSLKYVLAPSTVALTSTIFLDCSSLQYINVTKSSNTVSAFHSCYVLKSVSLAPGQTIGSYMFQHCRALESIALPMGVTTINPSAFLGCLALTSFVIPKTVKTISGAAFSGCKGVKYYDFSRHEAVPTVSSTSFNNISSDCKIIVPDGLVDEWKAATNWATYGDYIVGVSEYNLNKV